MYQRDVLSTLVGRLKEPRRFLQVLAGPRQVGKTTVVRQALEQVDLPAVYASADDPVPGDRAWLEAWWERGRLATREGQGSALLVLDEVQKVQGWSDAVKRLWDEDSVAGLDLKVVVLGSAPLLVQQGLTESLAGRFEQIRLTHWAYAEMLAAFGWDWETFVHFGGYPGAAPLVDDEERWRRYILDALIETSVGRDVLLLSRVDKPALLRRLFALACAYSGQVLSYQKMTGQLQDAGNTTTLAHYLDLLGGAGLVTGLDKHAGDQARRRGSSPKLLALNTALVSAMAARSRAEVRATPEAWGRLVESAVGAHLAAGATRARGELRWWRERDHEVDYVLAVGDSLLAIEVKSGRPRASRSGLDAFQSTFGRVPTLLVGSGGMPLQEFLATPVERLL